jgi:tRNA pseudouridine55 synthase
VAAYSFYKRLGITPLHALEDFRSELSLPDTLPLTYAGRLDPLAQGTLIILSGDTCKKKGLYLGLDKEYITQCVFGLSTDSGDMLGMPTVGNAAIPDERSVRKALSTLRGTITLPIPHYSTPTLSQDDTSSRTTRIFSTDFISYSTPTVGQVAEQALGAIGHVPREYKGVRYDFRFNEIERAWSALWGSRTPVAVVLYRTRVSSGTYIRSLNEELGRTLGTTASTLSLERTHVGRIVPGTSFFTPLYKHFYARLSDS